MASLTEVLIICIFTLLLLERGNGDSKVISEGVVTITSDNWRDLLTGEWMVEL